MPSTFTLAFRPSLTKAMGRRSTPRKSASNGANIASGPPAAPLAMAVTASTWASVADASTIRPPIQPPSDMIAFDCARKTKRTPSSATSPKRPDSIANVSATLQKSCVAGVVALRGMHGHRKSQLQASMYCPLIAHRAMDPPRRPVSERALPPARWQVKAAGGHLGRGSPQHRMHHIGRLLLVDQQPSAWNLDQARV